MRRAALLAILILAGLALPALAHAQGNSSIDQYTEEVPSAGGDDAPADSAGNTGVVPSSGGGGGGGGESQPAAPASPAAPAATPATPAPAAPVTPATSDQPAASNDTQSNAAGNGQGGHHGGSGSAHADSGPSPSDPAPAAVTLDRDSGSADGFNLLWPIILGASLLLAIAWAVRRHLRQRGQDGVGSPA